MRSDWRMFWVEPINRRACCKAHTLQQALFSLFHFCGHQRFQLIQLCLRKHIGLIGKEEGPGEAVAAVDPDAPHRHAPGIGSIPIGFQGNDVPVGQCGDGADQGAGGLLNAQDAPGGEADPALAAGEHEFHFLIPVEAGVKELHSAVVGIGGPVFCGLLRIRPGQAPGFGLNKLYHRSN